MMSTNIKTGDTRTEIENRLANRREWREDICRRKRPPFLPERPHQRIRAAAHDVVRVVNMMLSMTDYMEDSIILWDDCMYIVGLAAQIEGDAIKVCKRLDLSVPVDMTVPPKPDHPTNHLHTMAGSGWANSPLREMSDHDSPALVNMARTLKLEAQVMAEFYAEHLREHMGIVLVPVPTAVLVPVAA